MIVDVAVIGAGAAGLVSAKTLLQYGIKPVVFEKSRLIGGAWNPASGRMWDSLKPNLSKYTCSFSDFQWKRGSPMFPSRTAMFDYLDSYREEHIADSCFQFGCNVTMIEPELDAYRVDWIEDDKTYSRWFDGVIVATGFFNTPAKTKKWGLPGIVHSSQYRQPEKYKDQTVAVIGSSFSAHEIAADVRRSAKHVTCVSPKLPFILPRNVPSEDGILPIDLHLYRRQSSLNLHARSKVESDAEDSKRKTDALKNILGSIGCAVQGKAESDGITPPHVSISDSFMSLVATGDIDVVKGRVVEISSNEHSGCLNLLLEDGQEVESVSTVLDCTGYRCSVPFLHQRILDTLQYDDEDNFAPFVLCFDAYHPKLNNLGFVGMYKGPYFGVMELQAKLLCEKMTRKSIVSEERSTEALQDSLKIRNSVPRAQFPRFDYVGMMDELASLLGVCPTGELAAKNMFVVPGFYGGQREHVRVNIEEDIASLQFKSTPSVMLASLIGRWSFHRDIIESSRPTETQAVDGLVTFQHMSGLFGEARYREDGKLVLSSGKELDVFREYDYAVEDDKLCIYFVESGERAHTFLRLKFNKQESNEWTASSDHLCVNDLYVGTFKVVLDGIIASRVDIEYKVTGPNKDYRSHTTLLRQDLSN